MEGARLVDEKGKRGGSIDDEHGMSTSSMMGQGLDSRREVPHQPGDKPLGGGDYLIDGTLARCLGRW